MPREKTNFNICERHRGCILVFAKYVRGLQSTFHQRTILALGFDSTYPGCLRIDLPSNARLNMACT